MPLVDKTSIIQQQLQAAENSQTQQRRKKTYFEYIHCIVGAIHTHMHIYTRSFWVVRNFEQKNQKSQK